MANKDFDALSAVIEAVPELAYICLDVANGYSEFFCRLYSARTREVSTSYNFRRQRRDGRNGRAAYFDGRRRCKGEKKQFYSIHEHFFIYCRSELGRVQFVRREEKRASAIRK